MSLRRYSTGQAAKLLSVTPDTVLKMIKKGVLEASKTPGGHFRIKEDDLKQYMAGTDLSSPDQETSPVVYCWQYMADNGPVVDTCKKCIVFKVKAAKCFELAALGEKIGHRKCFCQNECRKCPYFLMVKSNRKQILVISRNRMLEESLSGGVSTQDIDLYFARDSKQSLLKCQEIKPCRVLVDIDEIEDIYHKRHQIKDILSSK